MLQSVEDLSIIHPDSAFTLLCNDDGLFYINEKTTSRWCLLHCSLAIELDSNLLPSAEIYPIYTFLSQKKSIKDKCRIAYYLGRACFEEKDYDNAMKYLSEAFEQAVQINEFSMAGNISKKMAEYYEIKNLPKEALDKYQTAYNMYKKTEDNKDIALALRDIGFTYTWINSIDSALIYLSQAESLIIDTNDAKAKASVFTTLATTYLFMGNNENAEEYFLKAIETDTKNHPKSYLALSELYVEKEIEKAIGYLEMAEATANGDEYFNYGLLHQKYRIHRQLGKYETAMDHLIAYQEIRDSIDIATNELDYHQLEKKFINARIHNEILRLRLDRMKGMILFFILILIILISIILHHKKLRKTKRQLSILKAKSDVLHQMLLQKENELQVLQQANVTLGKQFKEEIEMKKAEIHSIKAAFQQVRYETFKLSAIYKKAHKISQKISPGLTKSSFTPTDWKSLIKTIHEIYPLLNLLIDTTYADLSPTEKETFYLSFLNLDNTAESILLNCNIENIRKRNHRLRTKLGITGEKISTKEYLIQQLHTLDC